MDALGVEFQLKYNKCKEKLDFLKKEKEKLDFLKKEGITVDRVKEELRRRDAERRRRAATAKAGRSRLEKYGLATRSASDASFGADAVLRDLGINPDAKPSLGEAVAAADAANKKGETKRGGRRKTKKRRRKRKTKRKKRKTKKRRRKRKRKTKRRR